MMTHWIIAIGKPKLPVMSGNAMLTELSSGTTDTPNPISANLKKCPVREAETIAASDVIDRGCHCRPGDAIPPAPSPRDGRSGMKIRAPPPDAVKCAPHDARLYPRDPRRRRYAAAGGVRPGP